MSKASLGLVTTQGDRTPLTRRAISDAIKGAVDPRPETKKILVAILHFMYADLKDRLSVAVLSSPTFDVDKVLGLVHAPTAKQSEKAVIKVAEKMTVPNKRRTELIGRLSGHAPDPITKSSVSDMIRLIEEIIRSSNSRNDLVSRLLGIPIEDAKENFRKGINRMLPSLGVTKSQLNDALNRSGIPPKVLKGLRGSTLDYAREILARPRALCADHQLIWKVASGFYPPDPDTDSCFDENVKEAARWMTKLWDRSIRFTKRAKGYSIARDWARAVPETRTTVYLLCWMELPLVVQTQNVEPGKIGLFELARFFQKHASQPD
jgi:hypothetical protein